MSFFIIKMINIIECSIQWLILLFFIITIIYIVESSTHVAYFIIVVVAAVLYLNHIILAHMMWLTEESRHQKNPRLTFKKGAQGGHVFRSE